jgi:hypothetical protein
MKKRELTVSQIALLRKISVIFTYAVILISITLLAITMTFTLSMYAIQDVIESGYNLQEVFKSIFVLIALIYLGFLFFKFIIRVITSVIRFERALSKLDLMNKKYYLIITNIEGEILDSIINTIKSKVASDVEIAVLPQEEHLLAYRVARFKSIQGITAIDGTFIDL